MKEKMVGHGTWYDMMAKKIVSSHRQSRRRSPFLRCHSCLEGDGFHFGAGCFL
jgi:hypothetical protein